MARTCYAIQAINKIEPLQVPFKTTPHFNEFLVNFDQAGKTVAGVNKSLLGFKIFGGVDLSRDFPAMGQSALYCISECHSKEKIDHLVNALFEVINS